jgi:hypothetical protein
MEKAETINDALLQQLEARAAAALERAKSDHAIILAALRELNIIP